LIGTKPLVIVAPVPRGTMLLTLFAKFRIWGVEWVRVVLLAKVSQYFSAEKMLKGCPGPGRKGMESDGMGCYGMETRSGE